jgi:hypothetical protein
MRARVEGSLAGAPGSERRRPVSTLLPSGGADLCDDPGVASSIRLSSTRCASAAAL